MRHLAQFVPIILGALLLLHPLQVFAYSHEPAPPKTKATLEMKATPLRPAAGQEVLLQFLARNPDTGRLMPHIDYAIRITRAGSVVLERDAKNALHDHEGDLQLRFTGATAPLAVKGSADQGGVYAVDGPVFAQAGSYDIFVSIVGIEFNPIPPIDARFSLEVLAPTVAPTPQPAATQPTAAAPVDNSVTLAVAGVVVAVIVVAAVLVLKRRAGGT